MPTSSITSEQIRTELTEIFRNLFFDPAITLHDEMTAADVDGWDSLNHINLIVEVEQQFHIKLTLAEIQRLKNVGELIRLIGQKVNRS